MFSRRSLSFSTFLKLFYSHAFSRIGLYFNLNNLAGDAGGDSM